MINPWNHPEWKTTQEWQQLITDLWYDYLNTGTSSKVFEEKLKKFFETTINKR